MHKIACFYVTVSDSVLNKDSFVRSFIHSSREVILLFFFTGKSISHAVGVRISAARWSAQMSPSKRGSGHAFKMCVMVWYLCTAITEGRGECAEQGSEEIKIPATHTGRHYFRNLEGAFLLHYRSKKKSGMWPLMKPAVFTPHSQPCMNATAMWLRMLFGCNVSSEIIQKKLQRAIEGREGVHMLQTTSCCMVLVARMMKLSRIMTRNCGLVYSDVVTWESGLKGHCPDDTYFLTYPSLARLRVQPVPIQRVAPR